MTQSARSRSAAASGSPDEVEVAEPTSRCLTVVVGVRRFDVVVDEQLRVEDVLRLVVPDSELVAVSMAGAPLAREDTLLRAGLETGAMIVASPVGARVSGPVVQERSGWRGSRTSAAADAGSRSVLGGPDPASTAPLPDEPARGVAVTGAVSASGAGGRRAGAASAATPLRAPHHLERSSSPTTRPELARRRVLVGFSAVASALAVVAFTRTTPAPVLALVVGVVLVAGGVLAAQSGRGSLVRASAPTLGLAGGWVGLAGEVHDPRLQLVASCAAGAVVALAGRGTTGADRHVPRVWMVAASVVGIAVLVATSVGAQLASVALLLLPVGALVSRVVPDLVFDVEDEALLDINRLSVTSWSPREARRASRRGWHIDASAVRALVRAGVVQGLATHVAVLVVVGLGSLVVLLSTVPAGRATTLTLGVTSVAFALLGRAHRRRVERGVVRASALPPALALALPWLADRPVGVAAALAVVAVVAALALAVVAGPVGRGYRSLWAGRVADALESLALVAALPCGLWASGLVTWATSLLA